MRTDPERVSLDLIRRKLAECSDEELAALVGPERLLQAASLVEGDPLAWGWLPSSERITERWSWTSRDTQEGKSVFASVVWGGRRFTAEMRIPLRELWTYETLDPARTTRVRRVLADKLHAAMLKHMLRVPPVVAEHVEGLPA